MAIIQAMTTSFKAEILLGVHNFRDAGAGTGDTFNLALYTTAATLDANTTAFTTTGEVDDLLVSATNYTSGGLSLTNGLVQLDTASGVAFLDFEDLTFSNVTLAAEGALIYNSSSVKPGVGNTAVSNSAVAVLNFGGEKTATNGDFTIIFPTPNNTAAIIRIA